MFDSSEARLKKLIVHRVGNKVLEDELRLASHVVDLDTHKEQISILENYFLSSFKEPIYYQLTHATDLELNEVYSISSLLFESPRSFVKKSQEFARILYEYSTHPRIKTGELYVVYFENCIFNNEDVDAIGIFKCETTENFMTVLDEDDGFGIAVSSGINLKKPEKGCVILNTEADEGFRVMLLDGLSTSSEVQYWKDEFLKLKPVADNFYQTRNYLNLAKTFVTERLDEDFEVTKADQIDYLNRSLEYFRKNEQFNEQNFASEVFEHQSVIKSFKKFKTDFQDENDVRIVSEFEISNPAVKRTAKVFKSVLKLDRNFHIYIHGDKELIERGVDEDGRKYYKIYYDNES
jgi:hypothetical protein